MSAASSKTFIAMILVLVRLLSDVTYYVRIRLCGEGLSSGRLTDSLTCQIQSLNVSSCRLTALRVLSNRFSPMCSGSVV